MTGFHRAPSESKLLPVRITLAAAAALLAFATAAQPNALVANTDQTDGTAFNRAFLAQSFVTGSNPAGYTVSEIRIWLLIGSWYDTSLKLREDAGGTPGDELATFVNPAEPSTNTLSAFAAPPATTLAPDTTYWVSVNEGVDYKPWYLLAASDAETAEAGWSIGDSYKYRYRDTRAWSDGTESLSMGIHGAARALAPGDPVTAELTSAPAGHNGGRFTVRLTLGEEVAGPRLRVGARHPGHGRGRRGRASLSGVAAVKPQMECRSRPRVAGDGHHGRDCIGTDRDGRPPGSGRRADNGAGAVAVGGGRPRDRGRHGPFRRDAGPRRDRYGDSSLRDRRRHGGGPGRTTPRRRAR